MDTDNLDIGIAIENFLMITTVSTVNKLISDKKKQDAWILYAFYYKSAKIQETNQPKATISFCMKGLDGWGETRVRNAKNVLRELGLITDIKRTNELGKVTGWYIKLNFIATKELEEKSTLPSKPQGGSVQG